MHALNSPVTDYEDAIIEQTAIAANLDYIITRNLKDYIPSSIPAFLPEAFISFMSQL